MVLKLRLVALSIPKKQEVTTESGHDLTNILMREYFLYFPPRGNFTTRNNSLNLQPPA